MQASDFTRLDEATIDGDFTIETLKQGNEVAIKTCDGPVISLLHRHHLLSTFFDHLLAFCVLGIRTAENPVKKLAVEIETNVSLLKFSIYLE